jgi:hypothetical protein
VVRSIASPAGPTVIGGFAIFPGEFVQVTVDIAVLGHDLDSSFHQTVVVWMGVNDSHGNDLQGGEKIEAAAIYHQGHQPLYHQIVIKVPTVMVIANSNPVTT